MPLTSVLPSPGFSSRADVPASFTGVFSHRGVLVGVAWQGGRSEADRCCRHKPLGLTKVATVQTMYTKPLSEKWGSYQRAVVKIMEEQSVCAFSEKNKIRGWSEKPEICLERHYWLLQPVTNTDMPELSHTP